MLHLLCFCFVIAFGGVLAMTPRTAAIIISPFYFALLLAIGRSDLARVMLHRAAYIISGEASAGKTRNR